MPFRSHIARILLVDDEPSVRKVYVEALRAADREVVAVPDARAAWSALARDHFHAMLLDLRLPGESGLRLLERVHARWPDLSIALVTAYADVPTAVRAMRCGASDFVVKPSRPAELRALVDRLLPQGPHEGADYEALIRRAVSLGKGNGLAEAGRAARLALAADPSRPEALHMLGLLTERRAAWVEAQAYYRAALALQPTYGPSRANLYRLTSFYRRGEPVWPFED